MDFWGLFSWKNYEEKSTQKSTAKFKSEFGNFAAKIHTARKDLSLRNSPNIFSVGNLFDNDGNYGTFPALSNSVDLKQVLFDRLTLALRLCKLRMSARA